MIEQFSMYGIMYGVLRTTVYFPHEMKAAIENEAARRGATEAEVIRSAVSAALGSGPRQLLIRPAIPESLGEELSSAMNETLDELAGWISKTHDL